MLFRMAQITLEGHFINDFGLDSLDAVEIVMAVEHEFGECSESRQASPEP